MAVAPNPWLSAADTSAAVAVDVPAPKASTAASSSAPSSVFAPAGGFNLLGQKTEAQRSAQAALVARAFATPDLEKEFDEEKAKDAEAEAPIKKADPVVPGWGGWTGEGLKAPRNPKPNKEPKPASA